MEEEKECQQKLYAFDNDKAYEQFRDDSELNQLLASGEWTVSIFKTLNSRWFIVIDKVTPESPSPYIEERFVRFNYPNVEDIAKAFNNKHQFNNKYQKEGWAIKDIKFSERVSVSYVVHLVKKKTKTQKSNHLRKKK